MTYKKIVLERERIPSRGRNGWIKPACVQVWDRGEYVDVHGTFWPEHLRIEVSSARMGNQAPIILALAPTDAEDLATTILGMVLTRGQSFNVDRAIVALEGLLHKLKSERPSTGPTRPFVRPKPDELLDHRDPAGSMVSQLARWADEG